MSIYAVLTWPLIVSIRIPTFCTRSLHHQYLIASIYPVSVVKNYDIAADQEEFLNSETFIKKLSVCLAADRKPYGSAQDL